MLESDSSKQLRERGFEDEDDDVDEDATTLEKYEKKLRELEELENHEYYDRIPTYRDILAQRVAKRCQQPTQGEMKHSL